MEDNKEVKLVQAVPAEAATTTDQDVLDRLASRLQSAAALLLVLSVVHVGSLLGVFAFVASALVLFCAAPGAKGVARAHRRVRAFAAVTAILAVFSLGKYTTALFRGVPHHVAEEARMHCESVPKDLAEGVVAWGRTAWHVHEQLHHNLTERDRKSDDFAPHLFHEGPWHHDAGASRHLPHDDDDPQHHDVHHHAAAAHHLPHEEEDDAGKGGRATDMRMLLRSSIRSLHAEGGQLPAARDAPWRFSQASFCAKAERVVLGSVRAALIAGVVLALLTLFVAARVGRLARRLACAAGLRCAWKRCEAQGAQQLLPAQGAAQV